MAIYDLWLSRNNGPTVSNYVGHAGRLFFDPAERVLRISDGVTAGGEVFNGIVTVANTEPTANFQGQIWLDPQTYELWVYHNGNFIPTIDVATETKLGGVKLGPGVTVNGQGQIIINSEGLDFSFGNLAATTGTYPADYFEPVRQNDEYAILSSINTDEDIVLASNGTGAVRVVGDFSVRRANGNLADALDEQPIFRVRSDGQVRMLVPSADSSEGAFTIVGGLDAVFQPPVNTGVMLHITGIAGTPGVPSRIYNDAQNAFAAFVARRYNGTAASPTAVLANEEIMRLSGTAHNGTTIPTGANQRIVYVALGNQTLTNQGGAIELWTTPINTTTLAKVATVDSTGVTLESGKVLTGNVTGTATTATTATSAATAYSLANTSTTYVGRASLADTATKLAATKTINGVAFDGSANINVANTQTLTIGTGLTGNNYNGSAASTVALNTATLMANAVSATTATNAGYAYSFNTGTLVTQAVSAITAGTVTTAAQPAITSVGTLTSLTVSDGISDSLGNVRSIAIRNTATSYVLTAADNGQMVSITTGSVTINSGIFASPFGQTISIYNNSTTSMSILAGSGVTLRLAGTLSTGTRTLARYGVATTICVSSNTFVVSGAGLS